MQKPRLGSCVNGRCRKVVPQAALRLLRCHMAFTKRFSRGKATSKCIDLGEHIALSYYQRTVNHSL